MYDLEMSTLKSYIFHKAFTKDQQMKNHIKIFIAILLITLLSTSVNANPELDSPFQKHCQYTLDGKGEVNKITAGMMMGIIIGIQFMIPEEEQTVFSRRASYGTILTKVCKNTLNNTASDGFVSHFKWEALKMINK